MKRLAALVVLLLGAAPQAAAQLSHDLTVRARVQTSLTLTAVGETDFGILTNAGGTSTLKPQSPYGGGSAAQVTVTGDPDRQFTISFPADVLLEYFDRSQTRHTMRFTPHFSTHPEPQQSTSVDIANGAVLQLNATGKRYLWMGGDLLVAEKQASGDYQATVTLSVAYN